MYKFIGFSTVGRRKKFTVTDDDLIKQDLINSFNIRQGSLPGKPDVGTVLWDFLFENQIEQLQTNIEREVKRMVGLDPRLALSSLRAYPQENGILLELEVVTVPSTDAERLSVFFDLTTGIASYQ